MENHGLLNQRTWPTVRKASILGALAGAVITILSYSAAWAALQQGWQPLGLDIATPLVYVFWPADHLRLPIDFWEYTFLPGALGLICATLLNAVLLSAIGTLVAWLLHKLRKPQSA